MKNKNLRYFQLAFFLSFLTLSLNRGILFHILTALKLLLKNHAFQLVFRQPVDHHFTKATNFP